MGEPIYSLKNLNTIQVELTANCNAMCPACDRWVRDTDNKDKTLKVGDLNPTIKPYQGSKGHFTWEAWQNLFNKETLADLRMITYNGTWGDAILHPDIFSYTQHIIDTIKETDNKFCALEISTNAGLHSTDWWRELANLNKQFYQPWSKVIFCIDGLDDKTHQLYRRAVKWEKVMENAKAYIDEGGRAVWQWLQFDHNKHQTEQAEELAKELGFAEFWLRGSRGERLAVQKTIAKLGDDDTDIGNVDVALYNSKAVNRRVKHNEAKEGSISYITDKDKVSVNTKEITSKYKNYEDYRENTTISCSWGNKGKINVEFNGLVHPCCYVNHYMNNFWSKELDGHLEGSEYEIMTDSYVGHWNNLNHNNLQNILSHNFYMNDLEQSWKNKTGDLELPRLGVCVSHCGEGHENIRSYDVSKL
jgi:hypothetical protein